MNQRQAAEIICRRIYAMTRQAQHDFSGDQREFYCPMLAEAFAACGTLFPSQMAMAMDEVEQAAKDGVYPPR
jgi:hypothetical protein